MIYHSNSHVVVSYFNRLIVKPWIKIQGFFIIKNLIVSKEFSKLVAHVAHFLKAIGEASYNNELPHVEAEIRVCYNLDNNEAYIYTTPHSYCAGNGVESTFDWALVDKLTKLSEKYIISYRIGTDEHGILHFQIYV